MFVCKHIYIYMYISLSLYIYIYIYMCAYIHTHTYIHTPGAHVVQRQGRGEEAVPRLQGRVGPARLRKRLGFRV